MKKLISFRIIIFLFFSLILVFSCAQFDSQEDFVQNENSSESSADYPSSAFCTFSLVIAKDSSRTVYPAAYEKENLYYKFSYLDSASSLTNFPSDGSGVAYSVLVAKSFSLIVGEYTFALDAYSDSACTRKVLECTKTVTLTEVTSSLEMNMKMAVAASQTGSASVTLNFPSSLLVTTVTARLAKISDPEGSVDSKALTISVSSSEKSVTYTKENLAPGSYIIYFTLSGGGIEPTVIPELVIVASEKASSNSISPIILSEDSLNTNIIYVSSSGSDTFFAFKATFQFNRA